MAGQHDDGQPRMKGLNLFQQAQAIETRHAQVEQHQIDLLARQQIQHLGRIGTGQQLQRFLAQDAFERFEQDSVIVDGQQAKGDVGHSSSLMKR
jgi:predicted TIM-barrel enzyme